MQTKGQKTREHILKESRKLFTLHGFQNTSISEVIAATKVKKGNLYYHFPSKEELGLAVLIDAADEFSTILDASLVGDNPAQKIINSCQTIMELMQQTNFVGGCLFGNTALEMSGSTPGFRKILQELFSNWSKRLEQEILRAGKIKTLPVPSSPTVLATSIVALLEGGIMLSRVYQDSDALEECIITIKTLLGTE